MPARRRSSKHADEKLVGFWVSIDEHAELLRRSDGNISKYLRACVFAKRPMPTNPKPRPVAPMEDRRKTVRDAELHLALTKKEAALIDRLARLGRYKSRGAFIRARIFAPLDVRHAAELGIVVSQINEALDRPPQAAALVATLKQARAHLMAAGAIVRD